MFAIIVVLVILFAVCLKNQARKKEEEFSKKVSTEIICSQALKDAMGYFTDLSHLTRDCKCTLTFGGSEYSGKLYGEVVDAPTTIVGFRPFYDIIFREHERFEEEVNAQFKAGEIEIMQVAKAITDNEAESYRELTSEQLGQSRPLSHIFIGCLRGDIKPSNDDDMLIKHGFVLDFLGENDTNNPNIKRKKVSIFLKILQEKCVESFQNCNANLFDTTSLALEFSPVP